VESAAAEDAAGDSDSDISDEGDEVDDDDFGSEIDDELDSDLEEARGGDESKKKKKSTKDDDEGEGDLLEAEDSVQKKKRKKKVVDNPINKKKAKKDPHKPKRAQTAFLIYSNENRERVKKENPDAKFGDLAKIISASYKKLSKEELADLEKKVEKEKERYAREMKDYKPPADDAKDKKKKKDPNAPKRPTSAFMLYSVKMRPIIKEEKPGISFGELGKLVGERWRALSSEEKSEFEAIAKKDKERYNNEMAAYEGRKKTEDDGDDSSDGMDDKQDDDDSDDED